MAASSLRLRPAARIFLLSDAGRILLFRFEVKGRAPFWVTPGGECDPGEDFAAAAARELFEETGIKAAIGEQVAQTTPQFITVEGERVQADERYFVVRTRAETISTGHHTALERRVMTQHRWFAPEELGSWHEAIFPEKLSALIAPHL